MTPVGQDAAGGGASYENFGDRFSMKARMPSTKSSFAAQLEKLSASAFNCSLIVRESEVLTRRLAPLIEPRALRAICCAILPTTAWSDAAGDTSGNPQTTRHYTNAN